MKKRISPHVLMFIVLLCVSVCAAALTFSRRTSSLTAGIYIDGECVRRVDLNRVRETERYIVETENGSNVILIEPGRICVERADCPDQICVMQGWLPDSGLPVVCLPHHLMIQLEDAP